MVMGSSSSLEVINLDTKRVVTLSLAVNEVYI